MVNVIDDLFLVLNVASESSNIAYTYQTERVYNPFKKKLFYRRRLLKYQNGKLIEKTLLHSNLDIINFLNSEIKKYNRSSK